MVLLYGFIHLFKLSIRLPVCWRFGMLQLCEIEVHLLLQISIYSTYSLHIWQVLIFHIPLVALLWLLTAACIKTGMPFTAQKATELAEQWLSKESIPDWVSDFMMPLRGGWLIGNVSPACSSLVTPAQATATLPAATPGVQKVRFGLICTSHVSRLVYSMQKIILLILHCFRVHMWTKERESWRKICPQLLVRGRQRGIVRLSWW